MWRPPAPHRPPPAAGGRTRTLAHAPPSSTRHRDCRTAVSRRPPDAAAVAAAARVLGVQPDAPLAAVRTAWRDAIAAAHPDAGGTDEAHAAAINVAYETLAAARGSARGSAAAARSDGEDDADPFAPSREEPTTPFIDPFQCGIDPLRWRELQALARARAPIPLTPPPPCATAASSPPQVRQPW